MASIITDGGQRVCIVDPVDCSRFYLTSDPLAAQVPENKDVLRTWFRLVNNHKEGSYPLRIVYAGTEDNLKIRIQGVILDKYLAALGGQGYGRNDEMEPGISARFLRLGAGYRGWQPAWRAQMHALQNFIEVLCEKLGVPAPKRDGEPETLFARRIVGHVAAEGAFRTWDITKRGKAERRDARDLNQGDLVEISLRPEIVLVTETDGIPRASVFFGFQDVVRLKDQVTLLQDAKKGGSSMGDWAVTEWRDDAHIGAAPTVMVDDGMTAPADAIMQLLRGNNSDSAKRKIDRSVTAQGRRWVKWGNGGLGNLQWDDGGRD